MGAPSIETVPDLDFQRIEGLPADALYNRLVEMGIARKLINIAIVECRVPQDLAHDAAQEIRIAWAKATVRPKSGEARFSFGEVASYGHYIARHAALRTRRELGSPVRLPGSAFRKRKDGTTSVTPGLLAKPLDWNELEERRVLDDATPIEGLDLVAPQEDEAAHRTLALTPEKAAAFRNSLTKTQWVILSGILEGKTMGTLEQETGLKVSTLTRQMSAIRSRLQSDGLIG